MLGTLSISSRIQPQLNLQDRQEQKQAWVDPPTASIRVRQPQLCIASPLRSSLSQVRWQVAPELRHSDVLSARLHCMPNVPRITCVESDYREAGSSCASGSCVS